MTSMAISQFKVDYIDGMPDLDMDENTGWPRYFYWDDSIGDWAGYASCMENVDYNQADVLMQIQASIDELNRMKSLTDRYIWVADIQGWDASRGLQMDATGKSDATTRAKIHYNADGSLKSIDFLSGQPQGKPALWKLVRSEQGKKDIVVAMGVSREAVTKPAGK